MIYCEYHPSLQLSPFVECLWTLRGDAASMESELQPVLPDGRSELVVHLADPFDRLNADGRAERQPAVLFAGQLTNQLVLRPSGRIAVVGVRFRPDGAAGLFREPQDRLAGLTLPVSDLSPQLARAMQSVRDISDDPDRVAAHIQSILPLAIRPAIDIRVRQVVDRIVRTRGTVSIRDLAAAVELTPRHLERRFMTMVGISPKRLARIARFQHALSMLDPAAPAPGTHTAAACGFADQAHFVRDFRELAGCPPGEHMLQRAELTGIFTERVARVFLE
jgi:AraC-like DNA-binding protein